jgi:hypothetical protein
MAPHLTHRPVSRHAQPAPQVVPCSWQTGGPLRLASDRARIDNEVPVTIELVERLPHTSGKIKHVISDVARD